MVKESEYQKRLAAEKARLEQENYDGKSAQDIKWQAWVNMQKEQMREQTQQDHQDAQLSAEQKRLKDQQERERHRLRLQELERKR